MDCIFCKISKGEIPAYTLYEDEVVKVFLDIHPDTNGHTLIIPKEHYRDINDIPLDILKHINQITKDMYKLLKEKLNMDGLTITQNNEYGQEIKHYHVHLLPIYKESQPKLEVETILAKITK
jgi:histidine triad (HIT) family protein